MPIDSVLKSRPLPHDKARLAGCIQTEAQAASYRDRLVPIHELKHLAIECH